MKTKLCFWLFPIFLCNFKNQPDGFFGRANQIHSGIIRAGRLAVAKGNPEVKKIAEQMLADHTIAQKELFDILKTQNLNTNSEPDSIGQSALGSLTRLTGKPFDSAYMASQFAELKEEEILYSKESKNSSNEKVKAYAGKYLPKIQMHLQLFVGNSSAITTTMDSVHKH